MIEKRKKQKREGDKRIIDEGTLTVVIDNGDFSIPGVEDDVRLSGSEGDSEPLVWFEIIIVIDWDTDTLDGVRAVECQSCTARGVVCVRSSTWGNWFSW